MANITLPYGKENKTVCIPDERLRGTLVSGAHGYHAEKPEREIVRDAMEHPIGSPRLRELAKGKDNIVLIASDHTRPVPSKVIFPEMLKEIKEGNPNAKLTVLIATGFHRETTREELADKFGEEYLDRDDIRFVVHKSHNKEEMKEMGVLPSGGILKVNRIAAEADLLISEGFIEPHFFAGFSGGRKSILPGICNEVTVNENHSYRAISNQNAQAGVLHHNPIHEDMVYAARKVNVQFILNVAQNSEKKILAAFAGDLEQAHEEGVAFVRKLSQCPSIEGDIVITSNGGYPLDQNLYQTPKAVATAEACARENAVIIMCASCVDGMGGSHFEKLIVKGSVDEIDAYLSKIPPKETIPEQWCAQIYARILKKHKVILVTTYLDKETVEKANMIHASSPDEALRMAYEMKGKDAEVVVIPDGVSVLAVKE